MSLTFPRAFAVGAHSARDGRLELSARNVVEVEQRSPDEQAICQAEGGKGL
jgi:hypothetical protein